MDAGLFATERLRDHSLIGTDLSRQADKQT
jgi:hypothetical protein